MTVYVDNMQAKFGRMIMCHMAADSDEELHRMAAAIGIARCWFQRDHYDVCQSKRKEAIALGAVEIDLREMAVYVMQRRRTGRIEPLHKCLKNRGFC